MSTSIRINMSVELFENDDDSFTVKISSNSETYIGAEMVSRTTPTIRKEKHFKDRMEAEKYFAQERMKLEIKE